MRLFSNKKSGAAPQPTADSSGPVSLAKSDSRTDPTLIRLFDECGRERFITKEQWRKSVLPGTLKSNWNNPDQLYGIAVGSWNDGFHADIIDAIPFRRVVLAFMALC
jgi:hypothetical protein